jgi:hypothetical protein
VELLQLDAGKMAFEGLAGHTTRHVELLDNIHASADLQVIKPKHERTDGR